MTNLRIHAQQIWRAGVDAVDSSRLTASQISVGLHAVTICDQSIPWDDLRHIEVLGAGKAGAGMAQGVVHALRSLPPRITVSGWVNVPADCVQELPHIHLHAARPAGVNEPTAEAVIGTRQILRRAAALGPQDVCLMLISGGGSALLCLPAAPITLAEKLQVTRQLAAVGAPIEHLNAVRSQISLVKGGRLAHSCRAGRLIALIISDVIGDPVSIIASGPTAATPHDPDQALRLLAEYDMISPVETSQETTSPQARWQNDRALVPETVFHYLIQQSAAVAANSLKVTESSGTYSNADNLREDGRPAVSTRNLETPPPSYATRCVNRIVGNNRTALMAAAAYAKSLGYTVVDLGSDHRGEAADAGRELFSQLQQFRMSDQPVCVLSGGEPTVRLASLSGNCGTIVRQGGRNQELILAAIAAHPDPEAWRDVAILSGGTDGEDGPTDAAGAFADEALVRRMVAAGIDPWTFLKINNSYPFFSQLQGLLCTGPTHTNVMDLRVALAAN